MPEPITDQEIRDILHKIAVTKLSELDADKRTLEIADFKPSTQRAWIAALAAIFVAVAAIFTAFGALIGKHL